MNFYRTHLDRVRTNRKICGGGPDRLGYLKSWYLARLRERAPRLVPDEFLLRITERERVLALPTRFNTDDALVLRGLFGDREYDTPLITEPVRRVLDLGSHCGFGTAYWAARFPSAVFACVEPDPRNLRQLHRTIQLNDIPATVFAAAIAPDAGFQHFHFAAPSTNRLVSEPTNFVVPTITIDQVCESMQWDSIDLVKMDVEGVEADLVARAGAALRRTKYLIFELHSWVDGAAVKQGLEDLGFRVVHVNETGEQVFLAINQRPVTH